MRKGGWHGPKEGAERGTLRSDILLGVERGREFSAEWEATVLGTGWELLNHERTFRQAGVRIGFWEGNRVGINSYTSERLKRKG